MSRTQRSLYFLNVRRLSIFPDMSNFFSRSAASATEENMERELQKEMDFLSKTPLLTVGIFRDHLKNSIGQGGVKRLISSASTLLGGKEDPQKKEVEKFIKIADALSKSENILPDLKKVSFSDKSRVAKECQCDVSDVNFAMRQFYSYHSQHAWVQKRLKEGKPLPKTHEECEIFFKSDPVQLHPALKSFHKNAQKKGGSRVLIR